MHDQRTAILDHQNYKKLYAIFAILNNNEKLIEYVQDDIENLAGKGFFHRLKSALNDAYDIDNIRTAIINLDHARADIERMNKKLTPDVVKAAVHLHKLIDLEHRP